MDPDSDHAGRSGERGGGNRTEPTRDRQHRGRPEAPPPEGTTNQERRKENCMHLIKNGSSPNKTRWVALTGLAAVAALTVGTGVALAHGGGLGTKKEASSLLAAGAKNLGVSTAK